LCQGPGGEGKEDFQTDTAGRPLKEEPAGQGPSAGIREGMGLDKVRGWINFLSN